MYDRKKNFKLVGIIAVFLFLLIIILGIMGALGFFDRNPNGVGTRIDNYNHYLKDTPSSTKYNLFTAVYNILRSNGVEHPPESGALIRDGSFNSELQDNNDIYYSTFIIDIEEVQQSYYAQVSWSDDDSADLGGYPTLLTCPTQEQLIYPAFDCKDLLNQDPYTNLYDQNPLLNDLPIRNLLYNITYDTSDDLQSVTIIIDSTSAYLDTAIQKLKTFNSPSKTLSAYNITYQKWQNPLVNAFVQNSASDPLDFIRTGFKNVNTNLGLIVQTGSYFNYDGISYYYTTLTTGSQGDYTLVSYKCLLRQEESKWILVSTPTPILTTYNTPNTPINVLNSANNL